jgi:outer membrane protein TolC
VPTATPPAPAVNPAPAPAPAAEAAPAAAAPLTLGLRETLLTALERNRQLRVQRLGPSLAATAVESQRAAFDPALTVAASDDRAKAPAGIGGGTAITDTAKADASLAQTLPTGTTWTVDAGTARTRSEWYGDTSVASNASLTVSQALLKGAGPDANLASIRQARLDVDISVFELHGFTAALAAEVEQTYWDCALAEQQMAIVEQSLAVAKEQLDQTRALIDVGKVAEVELAAAEAEVALRNGSVIDARANRDTTHLHLLRLLDLPGERPFEREVRLADPPAAPEATLEPLALHVALALKLRPDLNQARLQLDRGDLELVKTRNGLLPQLDLFVSLGGSGYAASFGGSLSGDTGRGWDAQVGARFAYVLGNRAATAAHQHAVIGLEQARQALANQAQLAEADVRTAYIETGRAREQLAATAATRRAQEEKARVEREKFLVGKSTSLLVAQAERDLLQARIDEVQAVVKYLKDLVDLYRIDGSLLARRGIAAPGAQPAGR